MRDLADLLRGLHRDRLDRHRLLAGVDAFDLGGQILVRDPQRTLAQPPQRPHQRPGDEEHEDQRGQDPAEDDRGVADRRVASRRRLLIHR